MTDQSDRTLREPPAATSSTLGAKRHHDWTCSGFAERLTAWDQGIVRGARSFHPGLREGAPTTSSGGKGRPHSTPCSRLRHRRGPDCLQSFSALMSGAADQRRRLPLEDPDIATCLQNLNGDLGIVLHAGLIIAVEQVRHRHLPTVIVIREISCLTIGLSLSGKGSTSYGPPWIDSCSPPSPMTCCRNRWAVL
jgi:hypothetical protein